MITCRVSKRCYPSGWSRSVVDLERVDALPVAKLVPDTPDWSEQLFECSLLRKPALLEAALGLAPTTSPLVLKQVSHIDLYLRSSDTLHLIEVKKPSELGKWRVAASEIVRQWSSNEAWLRREGEPVRLWTLCPTRWSKRRGAPKLPETWPTHIRSLTDANLHGRTAAALDAVFYQTFSTGLGGEQFITFWLGSEEGPHLLSGSPDAKQP